VKEWSSVRCGLLNRVSIIEIYFLSLDLFYFLRRWLVDQAPFKKVIVGVFILRKVCLDLIWYSWILAIPKEMSTILKPIKWKTSGFSHTNSPRMRAKKGHGHHETNIIEVHQMELHFSDASYKRDSKGSQYRLKICQWL